jgi:hypothetical protein
VRRRRWANAQYDRPPELAADLVRRPRRRDRHRQPVAAIAAKNATISIPIVFSLGSDPVRDGLVASLNRPGRNVTGATFFSNLLSGEAPRRISSCHPKDNIIALLLNPKNANERWREGQRARRWLITTEAGIACLGYYHERKDEQRHVGLGPEHDFSSHAADSFGLMAICYEGPDAPQTVDELFERQHRYADATRSGITGY